MSAVFFTLKRSGWGYDDIYEALKSGEKTSEWRDFKMHWVSRLFKKEAQNGIANRMLWHSRFTEKLVKIDPSKYKHKRARFRVGFTKGPTLEADILAIFLHTDTCQLEIQIENVLEEDWQ